MKRMPRDGAHMRRGWRDRFKAGDVEVEIQADHRTFRRMPNAGEISRAVARGQPYGMVEDEEHQWAVIVGHRRVATIRQNPNGSFASGRHFGWTLRAVACRALGVNPDDEPKEGPSGDGEPTDGKTEGDQP